MGDGSLMIRRSVHLAPAQRRPCHEGTEDWSTLAAPRTRQEEYLPQ
jgi:hypothetical protein